MKIIGELKQMTLDDLKSKLLSLRKEQFNLRMKKASGALDKTHVIKVVRRNIARVKTVISEKLGATHVN
jgi:large subunit ribosomal protein L29